ncbi:MAG: serine/threonine protein kinase, partial [Methanosarcinales archaeon]
MAGSGSAGTGGDGSAATTASVNTPFDVSAILNTSSGGTKLFIADSGNHRIRCVDEGGFMSTVVGTGSHGFGGDGGAATAALLNSPGSVHAVYNASSRGVVLYITDTHNHRIRRVDESGTIATIAGSGSTPGWSGDGNAAVLATLNTPSAVVAVQNGSSGGTLLYIADTNNHRIRRVDEGGIISTLAGGGGCDLLPATSTPLNSPTSVRAAYNTSSGSAVMYIAEALNHRIRRVDEDGIITTVAGSVSSGFGGDGSAATSAKLDYPTSVFALHNTSSNGTVLFIADTNNHRIRRVDEQGIITTITGQSGIGYSGDGGVATAAVVNAPQDVFALYNATNRAATVY